MATQAETEIKSLLEGIVADDQGKIVASVLALLATFLNNQQNQTDTMIRMAKAMELQVELVEKSVNPLITVPAQK